jgi:hypothetical protein
LESLSEPLTAKIARGGLPGSPSGCTIEKQQIVIADPINDAGKAAVENTDPNGLTDYGAVVRLARVGASVEHLVSAAGTNATSIKASAGRFPGWTVFNNADHPVFVRFHKTASVPTPVAGIAPAVCQDNFFERPQHRK